MTIRRYPPRLPKRKRRSGSYSRAAAIVCACATRCWICGQGAIPGDPFVADHLVPRSAGGSDHISNLAAAHASCNERRGKQLC